jgi:hypothetical protein
MAKDKQLAFYGYDRLDVEECMVLHRALIAYGGACPADEVVYVEDIWTKLTRAGMVPRRVKTPQRISIADRLG